MGLYTDIISTKTRKQLSLDTKWSLFYCCCRKPPAWCIGLKRWGCLKHVNENREDLSPSGLFLPWHSARIKSGPDMYWLLVDKSSPVKKKRYRDVVSSVSACRMNLKRWVKTMPRPVQNVAGAIIGWIVTWPRRGQSLEETAVAPTDNLRVKSYHRND